MNKEKLESILEDMLSTGGDFAEIFIEDKKTAATYFLYAAADVLLYYSNKSSNDITLSLPVAS